MRLRRGSLGERQGAGANTVFVAAVLGVLLGSSVSLWTQRSSAAHVCAPAGCPTCAVCRGDGLTGAAAAASSNEPPGGTWRPAGRERAGNAELQKVLARVAINDEVMVAGAPHRSNARVLCPVCSLPLRPLHAVPVSNNALITPDGKYGMLQTWVECMQRSGVKNFMVIALDEHTGTR